MIRIYTDIREAKLPWLTSVAHRFLFLASGERAQVECHFHHWVKIRTTQNNQKEIVENPKLTTNGAPSSNGIRKVCLSHMHRGRKRENYRNKSFSI